MGGSRSNWRRSTFISHIEEGSARRKARTARAVPPKTGGTHRRAIEPQWLTHKNAVPRPYVFANMFGKSVPTSPSGKGSFAKKEARMQSRPFLILFVVLTRAAFFLPFWRQSSFLQRHSSSPLLLRRPGTCYGLFRPPAMPVQGHGHSLSRPFRGDDTSPVAVPSAGHYPCRALRRRSWQPVQTRPPPGTLNGLSQPQSMPAHGHAPSRSHPF